ncbi:unnamed protein product [Effrenium voratum]|uniref:Uncharacterized protein n=1 Tax=Effrenium voratum TaxID=2562239 RepID=A0AA36NGX3_9DINO|nr:unnamed protein product [Effrenium voratum]
MIVGPKLSLSMAGGLAGAKAAQADAKAKAKAKSKARESPLAAAARRARDAQSALGARAARASRQSRDASVGKEAKERKEGERQFAARPLIEKAKDKASSPFRRPPGSHSAISLNLKKKQEAKKPEEATSPDTSAGSTPAGLISEDTGTKPADRTEILEAAQVLRKEAQDLGRALRRWVAEAGPEKGESADLAEAEAEKTSEPCEVQLAAETEDEGPHISSPVGVPPTPVEVESLEPAADSADGSEVPAAAAAAPEGPARPREPGRRALEQECERLDADLQRVADEYHRLLLERQKAFEALEPVRPAAPAFGMHAAPAPLPMHIRATLGATGMQAPVSRATVPQAKPRSPSLSPGPPQDVPA